MEEKNKTQRCGVILFIFPQRLGVSALKTAFPSIEIKLALEAISKILFLLCDLCVLA
jgi:hypothetical protein